MWFSGNFNKYSDFGGENPLTRCVDKPQLNDLLEELLKKGANPNSKHGKIENANHFFMIRVNYSIYKKLFSSCFLSVVID
ncbi:MAG: hypothetical protein H0T84_14750 [Tatlockia sp.]|nr:hypothetical protein [Tatlockia sp.]